MDRPFIFSRAVPAEMEELPGVWKNKNSSGYRIPMNAQSVLGYNSPDPIVEAHVVDRALSGPLMRGDLSDFAKPHQKRMLSKALALSGSHSWAPPGAGKTLVGLTFAAACSGPRLIITKAAARGTWVEQCERYTHLEPTLLLGQTAPTIPPSSTKLYITAWETLKYWADAICALKPGVVVWDEIHWLRRPKHTRAIVQPDGSVRFQGLGNSLDAARRIAQKSGRKLGLTATPVPGRIRDLWTQLDMVEPWQWGTFHQFGMRYCQGMHNGYGYSYDGLGNEYELKERLSFVKVRVKREEVNRHLPKKRREVVRLTHAEQNKPAAMKREIKKAQKEGKDSYFETLLMEAASRKHKYVEDRVLEALKSKQKVVVFTGRRNDCDRLAHRLGKAVQNVKSCALWAAHGGADPAERDTIRHEYMAHPGPCLLIGTGDAWGESIDLQDTDLALITMLPWTPDKVIQWEGRFSRLGQQRPVLVSYVVARNTADEHVSELLLEKLPHVGEVAEDAAAEEIEGVLSGVDNSEGAAERLLGRIAQVAKESI
jgi:SWI/SNF-related matrix-associated actin-dependent regulator 1 of chromatin subfamily A